MSNFTPGPWEREGWYIKGYPKSGMARERSTLKELAVVVQSRGTWHDEATANARLICASPDLLEAAVNLLGDIDMTPEAALVPEYVAALRSAIAKAMES